MKDVILYRAAERTFEPYGGPPGNAEISRLIGSDVSPSIGAGVAVFEGGVSIAWTVLYDEVMVVLEGDFRLRAGDQSYDCVAGDILWIAENTPIVYESDGKATVFYALYPVDWRDRAGI